ncbi:hypothetical protein EDB86DRAFT_2827960 [Lactarius hatsudake]|nr:hypothetical protein EDB86DRAFT_2827960 [Lactarius hatsudake]
MPRTMRIVSERNLNWPTHYCLAPAFSRVARTVVREVRSRSWGHDTCGLALYWSNNVPGGISVSGMTEEATFAGRERYRGRGSLPKRRRSEFGVILSVTFVNRGGETAACWPVDFGEEQIAIASNVLGWGDRPRHGRESRNQVYRSLIDVFWIRLVGGLCWVIEYGYASESSARLETTCLRPVGLECREWPGPGGARANPARANRLCPRSPTGIGRTMYQCRRVRH